MCLIARARRLPSAGASGRITYKQMNSLSGTQRRSQYIWMPQPPNDVKKDQPLNILQSAPSRSQLARAGAGCRTTEFGSDTETLLLSDTRIYGAAIVGTHPRDCAPGDRSAHCHTETSVTSSLGQTPAPRAQRHSTVNVAACEREARSTQHRLTHRASQASNLQGARAEVGRLGIRAPDQPAKRRRGTRPRLDKFRPPPPFPLPLPAPSRLW
jgi:hypothetical protein